MLAARVLAAAWGILVAKHRLSGTACRIQRSDQGLKPPAALKCRV